MAYATQQHLIDRFGANELIQRTDKTNKPATTIDGTVVAAAISDAEAFIDGYLAKRYKLPLSSIPPVLIPITADIARYYLHDSLAQKDSPVAINHNKALAWLKDVSLGHVQLEVAGVHSDQDGAGGVRTSGSGRVFSRDSMGGY